MQEISEKTKRCKELDRIESMMWEEWGIWANTPYLRSLRTDFVDGLIDEEEFISKNLWTFSPD